MHIPVYCISITPENIPVLWVRCKALTDNIYRRWFDPFSEMWLLRADMLIARKRYRGDQRKMAEYLRAGREDWGVD